MEILQDTDHTEHVCDVCPLVWPRSLEVTTHAMSFFLPPGIIQSTHDCSRLKGAFLTKSC